MPKPKSETENLVDQLGALLADSPLSQEEKVRALLTCRQRMAAPDTSLTDWRSRRAQQGPVGSGKKAEAMREQMKSKTRGK